MDIKPGAPTPIGGIVFVKAGNTHTDVGFHEAGYVAASPNNSAVSHVDVCPVPTRQPLIVLSDFVDGTFVCGAMTVVQTRTKTTTIFTPTISGFTEAVTVTQEIQAREVTVRRRLLAPSRRLRSTTSSRRPRLVRLLRRWPRLVRLLRRRPRLVRLLLRRPRLVRIRRRRMSLQPSRPLRLARAAPRLRRSSRLRDSRPQVSTEPASLRSLRC